MYLHNEKGIFKDVIVKTAKELNISENFIEKDYYITMILKALHSKRDDIVFKGGTSLSKCYNIINRFSEDIDISFEVYIGESKRNKLKNTDIKSISDSLKLPIINWSLLHSNNDVNKYIFTYQSIFNTLNELGDNVSLETSLLIPSFPVNNIAMDNYIYKYLNKKDAGLIKEYNLAPFEIKCQSLERTFIDKVFAICDYYLLNKSTRLSRHLYDIYKLYPDIKLTNIKSLINEVRSLRSKLDFCPSAKNNVDINKTLTEIIETNYYKNDYNNITARLIFDSAVYEDAIISLRKIISDCIF